MLLKATDARVALALFASAFIVYFANGGTLPPDSDTIPNIYLPASIVGEGDPSFSPFEAPFMFLWTAPTPQGAEAGVYVPGWLNRPPGSTKSYAEHYREGRLKFAGWKYYLVPTTRARAETGEPLFVGVFGPMAGLLMLPAVAAARGLGASLDPGMLSLLGKLTAATLVAASVSLVYLTVRRFVERRRALLLALIYAFASCAWAVASQSLWQQTPEMFFLSLGFFFLLATPDQSRRSLWAGLAFSAAAACRPTAAIVALVAAGGLVLCDKRALGAFILGALPLSVVVLAWNFYYFGSPVDFGQLVGGERVAQFKTGSANLWQTPLWLGAAGLLLSPGRGLLIYSPVFAAALAGAVSAWMDRRHSDMRIVSVAVAGLWVPAFLWFDWWGGWAYGYRPIMDSLPLLTLLCVPVLDAILRRPAVRAALFVALGWSLFVQALGAFAYSPWGWNMKALQPGGERANVDLPAYQHRLWSFRDWQIGYLIANFRLARLERKQSIAY